MYTGKQSGNIGEEAASRYLKLRGYEILERNYSRRGGEIDIIAQKDGVLVFIEVKTRFTDMQGRGFLAVTKAKQRRIYNTAKCYLADRDLDWERLMRFDVIDIYEGEITHHEGAFTLSGL